MSLYHKNIDDKISSALLDCWGILDGYDTENMFSYLYPFTTENIAGYMDYLDFNNKSLLTVGSSTDQVLNAILKGCNDITVIDLCPYAREYFYLKSAAIETLNREEFLDYFCYRKYKKPFNNIHVLNKSEYIKLRNAIANYNPETLKFWDTLFKRYTGLRIRKRLFNYDELPADRIKEINPYLSSDEAYNSLRKKIKDVYIRFDVDNLFERSIKESYDIINLSNIWDYHNKDNMLSLINKMINSLTDEGILIMAYMYLVDKTTPLVKNDTYQKKLSSFLEIVPKEATFSTFDTIKASNYPKKDTIVTYKKVKKILNNY